jgi:transcription elongation factor GreA
MADQVWLTPAGRAQAQAELARLVELERPAMGLRLREARADGGEPGENLALAAAQDEQAQLEARIARIEDRLRRAVIIAPVDGSRVVVGSRVLVLDLASDIERWYTIVGVDEAAPSEGRISDRSPLGQALLDAEPGERRELVSPKGARIVEVRAIETDA